MRSIFHWNWLLYIRLQTYTSGSHKSRGSPARRSNMDYFINSPSSDSETNGSARENVFVWRKAKGDATGVGSIALKARENLRQLAKYNAVALEYATRAFCATKFIANAGRKAKEQCESTRSCRLSQI